MRATTNSERDSRSVEQLSKSECTVKQSYMIWFSRGFDDAFCFLKIEYGNARILI